MHVLAVGWAMRYPERVRTKALLGMLAVVALSACGSEGSGEGGGSSSGESSSSGGAGASSSGGGSSSSSSSSSSSGEVTLTLRGKAQVIMNDRCTGCHGETDPEALLDLTDLSRIVNADSFEMPGEKVVVPGDPDASVLVMAIEGDPPGSLGRMPARGPRLPDAEIAAVREWVQAGAE